jgi:tetratricopeptide (TPR) repeat protein
VVQGGALTLVRNATLDTPTLNVMAGLLIDRGRSAQAERLLKESIRISEGNGDFAGRALGLCQLSRLLAREGDAEGARIVLGDALATLKAIEGESVRAALLYEMAGLLATSGDVDQALTLYLQSLAIKEDAGDLLGAAATLHEIAALRVGRGEVDEAIWLCREALDIRQRLGDEPGRAATLRLMGSIHATRGQIDRSLARFEQSLDAFDRARDPHGRAAALCHMAGLLADIGKVNQATKLLREAMALSKQTGNACGVAETLRQTASLMASAGKIDGALRFLQKALAIYESAGNVQGQAATRYEMGYQLSLRRRLVEARVHLERALQLAEQVGDPRQQGLSLVRLAQLTFAADPAEAFLLLRRGERLLARIGSGRDLLDALQTHRAVARAARQDAEFCRATANLVYLHLVHGDATRAAESAVRLAQRLPVERADLAHRLTAFALLVAERSQQRDVVEELAREVVAPLEITLGDLRELTPEVTAFVEDRGALSWVEVMLGEWLLDAPRRLVTA